MWDNHPGIHHQAEIPEVVAGLGVTVLAALHDLNLAALFCNTIHGLSGGQRVTASRLAPKSPDGAARYGAAPSPMLSSWSVITDRMCRRIRLSAAAPSRRAIAS